MSKSGHRDIQDRPLCRCLTQSRLYAISRPRSLGGTSYSSIARLIASGASLWRTSAPSRRPVGFIEPCIPTRAAKPPVGPQWKSNGFGTAFNRAKIGAGLNDRDLHFHDLRGTAATKFYIAGLPIRVTAEILAWSEEQVERIIRRYVGRSAATKAAIQQLNEARGGTKSAKLPAKPHI